MTQRMNLSERAIQMVAEDKIRAAVAAGQFDTLPGLGKPAPLIDEPYDPLWWVRRKLRRESLMGLATHSLVQPERRDEAR